MKKARTTKGRVISTLIRSGVKHGQAFKALMSGVVVSGFICKEGDQYWLAQDQFQGDPFDERFGKKYTYTVGTGSKEQMYRQGVKHLQVFDKYAKPTCVVLNHRYTAKPMKGYVKVGCQRISNLKILQLIKLLK